MCSAHSQDPKAALHRGHVEGALAEKHIPILSPCRSLDLGTLKPETLHSVRGMVQSERVKVPRTLLRALPKPWHSLYPRQIYPNTVLATPCVPQGSKPSRYLIKERFQMK
jgi:hypothetical protein